MVCDVFITSDNYAIVIDIERIRLDEVLICLEKQFGSSNHDTNKQTLNTENNQYVGLLQKSDTYLNSKNIIKNRMGDIK